MIYTDDKVVLCCSYSVAAADEKSKKMSSENIDRALDFAKANCPQSAFICDGYILYNHNQPEKTAIV